MARGGGRGGGRSGGSGGSRRSGGRSSSGGRGGSSWGSRSSSSSGSGWNRRSSGWNRPIIIGSGGYRRRRPYGSSMHRGYSGDSYYDEDGCGKYIGYFVLFAIIVFLIAPNLFSSIGNSFGGGTSITPSTIVREPLPSDSVNETDYYTDEANWVENHTVMVDGLRYFYQETGVQPHVYITTEIDNSHYATVDQVGDFAEELYDDLFTDEAHLLLVFYEGTPSRYVTYYVAGNQAKQVIDTEAADILLDYIDRYYYDENLNTSEFFSKSFRDAADRIMEVTTSPWIKVLMVLGVLAIVALLYRWWQKRKEQEAIDAKRTEDILNTPLETFGQESQADELAKKYMDDNDSSEL